MHTAIILNLRQAKIFASQPQAVEEIISFCPSATYFLQSRHYRVISTATLYGAISHAKTTLLIARELPQLRAAAALQYQLNDMETEGLSIYLYHYLCCIYHLHFSLRHRRLANEIFYWVQKKNVRQGNYETMFAELATQPPSAILSYAAADYSIMHYGLTALYNRILYFCIARSPRLKVIDYGDELPKRLIQAMIDNGENPLVMHTHTIGKNIYKTTRFFIKSLARLARPTQEIRPIYLFRIAPPAHYRRKVAAFKPPSMHASLVANATKQQIENLIPFARTETLLGKKIIAAIKPAIAVSDHAKYFYILGGLETMKHYGGKHAMLNHGTHTMQYDRISHIAAKLWGEQERIINRNTTHSLPKSPLTALLTREIRSDNQYQICKLNVYGNIKNRAARDGKFVILQAGNYTDAYNHIPWCKETADEYLLAIIELLEEVGKRDNVELIIKLKNKKADTHKKIVEEHIARLGIADKARVDTTSKFSDLMERAHIVVCNLSGTIEEALANQMPIMIHTYRKHYFHIPDHTIKSSSIGNIAPAYLVKERADIGRIITLLDTHRSALNNPDLYQNVAWQKDEQMPIRKLAAQLVRDATL